MGPGGVTISRSVDRPSPSPSSSRSPGPNGSPPSGGATSVQRAVDAATAAAFVATAPTMPARPTMPAAGGQNGSQTVRRMTTTGVGTGTGADVGTTSSNGNGNGHDRSTPPGGGPPVLSTTEVLDRVDEMMAHLEERILEELERRGGRFTGTF